MLHFFTPQFVEQEELMKQGLDRRKQMFEVEQNREKWIEENPGVEMPWVVTSTSCFSNSLKPVPSFIGGGAGSPSPVPLIKMKGCEIID